MPSSIPASHRPPPSSRWSWSTGEQRPLRPAPGWLSIGGRGATAVQETTAAPAVGLGSELAFQLHEAPDPGAVGAEVRLDRGGQLADGGQVDAEQLRALLQRRR